MMEELLRTLALARARRENLKALRLQASETMCATKEGKAFASLDDVYRMACRGATDAEDDARTAIRAAYSETGQKKIAPGATVRVKFRAVYDVEVATEWARTHAPDLLVLHGQAFEEANLPNMPLEWVEEATPIIASDLSAYMPDTDGEAVTA